MDIPLLSTSIAQSNLSQAVGISVLKMANDQSAQQGQEFIQMMERSVQPNLGGKLDIRG
ncbi:Putative motility protein [Paenibacillus sp. yr247]|uniref:YjfB family protein n=1 Tax=Paenibacillus sp. yr247 TaxID=1761880 RepID=UPI0008884965|nr:YjfB family protein [Paenibacillus sp. yr247]SDN18489.1 Putative motility protein [Paenibacillus sp. yr247]